MIFGIKFIEGALSCTFAVRRAEMWGGGLETYRHLNFYKKKPMDDIIRLVFPCCCVFFFLLPCLSVFSPVYSANRNGRVTC